MYVFLYGGKIIRTLYGPPVYKVSPHLFIVRRERRLCEKFGDKERTLHCISVPPFPFLLAAHLLVLILTFLPIISGTHPRMQILCFCAWNFDRGMEDHLCRLRKHIGLVCGQFLG